MTADLSAEVTAVATVAIAVTTFLALVVGGIAATSAANSLRLEAEPTVIVFDATTDNLVPETVYVIVSDDEKGLILRQKTLAPKDLLTYRPTVPFVKLKLMNAGRSPCIALDLPLEVESGPGYSIPTSIKGIVSARLITPSYGIGVIIENQSGQELATVSTYGQATRNQPLSGKRVKALVFSAATEFFLRRL